MADRGKARFSQAQQCWTDPSCAIFLKSSADIKYDTERCVWGMSGASSGHVWDISRAISGTYNEQQSAVLHASVMPFYYKTRMLLCNVWAFDDHLMSSYLVTSMLQTLPSVLSAPHPPASPQPPWIHKQYQCFMTHTQSQVFTWNLKSKMSH